MRRGPSPLAAPLPLQVAGALAEAGASLDEIVKRVSAVTKAMGRRAGPSPVTDKRHQHGVDFSPSRAPHVPAAWPGHGGVPASPCGCPRARRLPRDVAHSPPSPRHLQAPWGSACPRAASPAPSPPSSWPTMRWSWGWVRSCPLTSPPAPGCWRARGLRAPGCQRGVTLPCPCRDPRRGRGPQDEGEQRPLAPLLSLSPCPGLTVPCTFAR